MNQISRKKYAVFSGITAILLSIIPVFVSNSLLNVVIRLLGTMLIWIAASVFTIQKKPKGFITQSFFIYVSHIIVLECIEKMILIVFKNTLAGAWIDFVIAPIITIGLLFIGYLVFHRFTKLWNILTGSRS